MKKLLIALFFLICVVLIAPQFIGGVVETEHQLAMEKLNENPAVSVNSKTFSRQWFDGKAITEIAIKVEGEELNTITFIVEENLSFGPVIFTDQGVEFALSYSQANINFKDLIIDEEIETFIKENVHLSALLTFSKNIVTYLSVDEVEKEIDGNNVVSAKASGKFTLDSTNRFYGNFNWAGLSATTNEESFAIEKLAFSVDQTLIAGDYLHGDAISTGDFDFTLAAITAKDTTGSTVLKLDNLLISAISSVKDDLMNITMNYSADKILSAGQQLEKANLDIVFSGLNIHVMQEINTFMSSLSADGEAMFNAENMQQISLLVAKLLADDPLVEVKDLSVQTPEGKIESAMKISVDKNLFDTANIMSIMAAVKADANGKAPMPFFDKLGLAPMIGMYVDQGFIIQKEDELSFKLNYAQGKLDVNGKIIPM